MINTTDSNLKVLEGKIFDLEKIVDKRALLQDDDLPRSISNLRDRVIYIHRIAEQAVFYHSVNIVLDRAATNPHYTSKEFESWADLMGDLGNYVNNLRSFKAQFDFAKYLKAIPSDLLSKIWILNETRNRLVHTKDDKWKIYLERDNYYGVLKLCCEILEKLDTLEAWFDKVDKKMSKQK